MVMVGAFLGGVGESIAAGHSIINLQIQTDDGANISGATFTVAGTGGTFTAVSGSDGRATVTVPSGQYTVSISTGGSYSGLGDQTLVAESKREYSVLFYGIALNPAVKVISPGVLNEAEYTVTDSSGNIVKNGAGWMTLVLLELSVGSFTLNLTSNGDTISIPFTINAGEVLELDLGDYFCKLVVKNTPRKTTYIYNGYTISNAVVAVSDTSDDFFVLRSSTSKSLSFASPLHSDGSTVATMTAMAIVPDQSIKEISVTTVGTILLKTASGDFNNVSHGYYDIFVVGGGGGGGANISSQDGSREWSTPGGGGSGRMTYSARTLLNQDTYSITIGVGGAESSSGGASSFGTLVSASGGNAGGSATNRGSGGYGGSGGAGGGGGRCHYYGTAGGSGGRGYFGGGGGGGAGKTSRGTGGSGGTFGGKGGSGYYSNNGTSVDAESGSAGVVAPANTIFSGQASDKSAPGGAGQNGYGGGGGGYGAGGGPGGYYDSYNGGGGGGGGVAGGDGGYASYSRSYRGKGYGAGGAGAGKGGGGGGGGYGATSQMQTSYGLSGCVVLQWVARA